MIPSADFGRTGRRVSRLGFGAWAIGGSWGSSDATTSLGALQRALDPGVTFIDTADVYGDGRSEALVARVRRPDVLVATKAGRRLPAQTVEGYSRQNLLSWVDRSRRLLGMDTLDLLQLHCPPTALYRSDRVFRLLASTSITGGDWARGRSCGRFCAAPQVAMGQSATLRPPSRP